MCKAVHRRNAKKRETFLHQLSAYPKHPPLFRIGTVAQSEVVDRLLCTVVGGGQLQPRAVVDVSVYGSVSRGVVERADVETVTVKFHSPLTTKERLQVGLLCEMSQELRNGGGGTGAYNRVLGARTYESISGIGGALGFRLMGEDMGSTLTSAKMNEVRAAMPAHSHWLEYTSIWEQLGGDSRSRSIRSSRSSPVLRADQFAGGFADGAAIHSTNGGGQRHD
jgi:hypothetical protein